MEKRDARTPLGFVEVGSRHQDGDALREKLRQELPEFAARDGVHSGRRLVEHDDLGFVHQRAGERKLLLHAARQPVCETIAESRELRELEQTLAPFAHGGLAHVETVNLGEKRDVFVDRQIAVQAEALREVAQHARGLEMLSRRVTAEHPHGAGVGLQESAYEPDGRCLSSAVGPDEPEHFSGLDRQRQFAHRDHGAVLPGDAIQLDGRHFESLIPNPQSPIPNP